MAYDIALSQRIEQLLIDEGITFIEKKMFGGNAFMINDKMCIGVTKEMLMLRCLDAEYEKILSKKFASPMQFTGKVMKGFVFVSAEGFKTDKQLLAWMKYGLDFAVHGIVKSKTKKKS